MGQEVINWLIYFDLALKSGFNQGHMINLLNACQIRNLLLNSIKLG